MATTRFVSAGLRVCLVVLLVCAVWSNPAYAQPTIDHPGIECIAPGKFAVILSGIDPDREVQTAKVYFRSNLYSDFYYVEMTYENGRFQGILPRPSSETTRIIYYLEAIDNVFNGARSLEWDPLVQECDDDPAAVYFTGEETGIVIGATTAGQSAIPAGFSAAGIAGTIAAAGVASGVGAGIGAGTAVVVGAVAAGAAGAAVVTSGAEEEPTTTVVAAATTTVGGTTTVAGSTTTSTGGASTTSSIITTTIATTTVALAPLNASCFTIQPLSDCRVEADATCVSLPVDRYEWVLDIDDLWERVILSDGPSIVLQDWSSSCDDNGGAIRIQLTVHRGPDSDTAIKHILDPGNALRPLPDGPEGNVPRARFESQLDLPGVARGRIVVNGTSGRIIDSSQPVVIDARGPRGVNTIMGMLIGGSRDPGVWRFDFRNEPRFERGSLAIVRGEVLTVGPNVVVFRLKGRSGEGIEFTYQLRQ